MKKVLLTGAAGIVGCGLRPLLAARYHHILLTDLLPVKNLAPQESFQAGDITDLAFVQSLAIQVEGIVHLAALVGAVYTFDEVLGPNITGTHNIYEAARREGVSHVVYASSHHAVGFCKRGAHIDHTTAPRGPIANTL